MKSVSASKARKVKTNTKRQREGPLEFPLARYDSVVHDPCEDGGKYIDVDAIREHLRKLSDAELIWEGQAACQLATGTSSRVPRKVFVVRLEECLAEWRRPASHLNADLPDGNLRER